MNNIKMFLVIKRNSRKNFKIQTEVSYDTKYIPMTVECIHHHLIGLFG